MGVQECDPENYIAKYGSNLVDGLELPAEVCKFKTPVGEILAAHSKLN